MPAKAGQGDARVPLGPPPSPPRLVKLFPWTPVIPNRDAATHKSVLKEFLVVDTFVKEFQLSLVNKQQH